MIEDSSGKPDTEFTFLQHSPVIITHMHRHIHTVHHPVVQQQQQQTTLYKKRFSDESQSMYTLKTECVLLKQNTLCHI